MSNQSSIDTWISLASHQLFEAGIPSAHLDAELILAHTIKKPRTYLHARPDETLDARTVEVADARVDLRRDRVPLAYIIGHKEFYGRRFHVTTATLIPRPESEAMIELLKKFLPDTPSLGNELVPRVVDVGTGSGALGITAKLERPHTHVSLLDISRPALNIAEKNAHTHHAEVHIVKSDLLSNYPFTADIALANLPYVGTDWEVSPEVRHEPKIALFADDDGLHLIKKLLRTAPVRLSPNGIIILEADRRQHDAIIKYASELGYKKRAQTGLALAVQRQAA